MINAFRHQRFLHFATVRSTTEVNCDQRLSASKIFARVVTDSIFRFDTRDQRLSASKIFARVVTDSIFRFDTRDQRLSASKIFALYGYYLQTNFSTR